MPGDVLNAPFNFVLEDTARGQRGAAKDPLYQKHAEIFFSLYFIMTGIHATHMIIGLGILAVLMFYSWRGKFDSRVLQPARDDGPLLALRRHRLDLPLPPALPAGRPARHG